MRVDVGRYSVDPRDVAGVTRGAGARGLELTVHIFPPKKVRDQIQSNRQIRALRVPPNIRPSAPKVRPRPDRSLTDNPQGLFGGGKRSGDLRRPVTLSFNSEAELFTARRDILRRCMPHGNLWGWGETGRRDSVSGAVAADAAPEPSKAGRLLVLVNPAAGKGRGVAAYERDVAPVLAALSGCGVVVEMRVTALRGEAMKIANALDLDAYRAVVCVGGDGTLAEVFNGLMTRPDAARAQSFPVGVVPAGSGNAVAKSLTHRVAQPCDNCTAALAIARGHLVSLDRAEFRAEEAEDIEVKEDGATKVDASPGSPRHQARSERLPIAMHALLSLSWGFFSDVDIESERWRFLGGARFTVGAIVRVLFMRRYDARIRFRPLGAEDAADAAFFLEDGSSDDDDDQDGAFYNKFDISRSRKRKGSTYNVSGAHRMGNPHDSRVAKRAAKAAARGATAGVEMPDRPGWREIAGSDVQGVWALNLPWAAEDMFAAPAAQCSDGAFDLLVFKGHSRLSLLLNLLKLDAGRHVPHSRVTYVKASELEVVPGASSTGQGGYIAVDGELVARAREVAAFESGGHHCDKRNSDIIA